MASTRFNRSDAALPRLNQGECSFLQIWPLTFQPVDATIGAKPALLAANIAVRVELQPGTCLLQRRFAAQIRADLAIAQAGHGWQTPVIAARHQGTHLLDESVSQHRVDPAI